MIVLDEDAVVEPEAMVVSSAASDGVLLQQTPARQGLARVVDLGLGAADRPDVLVRGRRDPAETLEEVQQNSLGAEHGTHVTPDFESHPSLIGSRLTLC